MEFKKIVVINGSPKGDKGFTSLFQSHLVKGCETGGAEVTVIYLNSKNIKMCTGCFGCHFFSPGECVIKDDIQEISKKVIDSDLIIFSTPIFIFSMTASLKALFERLFYPFLRPEYVLTDNNRILHPIRNKNKVFNIMLMANGGFDGEDVIGPLLDLYNTFSDSAVDEEDNLYINSIGSIYIGFCTLLIDGVVKIKVKSMFDILEKVGREIVETGKISRELLEKANRPVYAYLNMTREEAVEKSNNTIQKAMSLHQKTRERYAVNKEKTQ